MKKKTLLMSVSALALVCGVASCGHEHEFGTTWEKDATHHWHAAVCEHAEEVSDKAEHTWNAGTVTKEATEEAKGEKTYKCTVCDATKTEEIAQLAHTHKYSTEWSKDETHHWHASACGHEAEVADKAEHTWNAGEVTKNPTYAAAGEKTYECTVCGEDKVETVAKLDTKLTSDISALTAVAKGSLTSDVSFDGFTFKPGEKTDSSIEELETPVEIDGFTFTKVLKSGGSTQTNSTSGVTSRVIEFEVTGAGKVTVYAKSGKTGEAREISVVEVARNMKQDWAMTGDNVAKYELEIHSAGKYQISFGANVSVYHIDVAWEDGTGDANWLPALALKDPNVMNVSEWIGRTVVEDTTIGNFTINAGAKNETDSSLSQHVTIESNSKKYQGTAYTNRLKLEGVGTADYRSVSITTTGRARITVLGLSASSSETRNGLLKNAADDTLVASLPFAGTVSSDDGKTNLAAQVYTVEAAGTYYFASETGGINIYAITVEALPTEMTVTQALEAADDTYVSITGTVKEVNYSWSSSNKNMSVTITDGTNELYVYKLGTNVELNSVVEITGYLDTYNGEKQIAAGAEAEVITPAPTLEPATIAEAIALPKGSKVALAGTVKSVDSPWDSQHGNMCVTITDGTTDLYVYRVKTQLVEGQEVVVTGYMDEYQDKVQIGQGSTAVVKEVVYDEAATIDLTQCTTAIEGKKQAWNGLIVDATAGKFALNSSQDWIQVNAGTVITLKVGEGAVVSVNAYTSAENFTIAEDDGTVTITATANDYLKTISVYYPVVFDEATTIDLLGFEGTLQGSSGKGNWNGLEIDATTGKFGNSNGSWLQFNTGAVIKLNVAEGAQVTVATYTANTATVVVENGVATITAVADDYIKSITIAYPTQGGGEEPDPTPTPTPAEDWKVDFLTTTTTDDGDETLGSDFRTAETFGEKVSIAATDTTAYKTEADKGLKIKGTDQAVSFEVEQEGATIVLYLRSGNDDRAFGIASTAEGWTTENVKRKDAAVNNGGTISYASNFITITYTNVKAGTYTITNTTGGDLHITSISVDYVPLAE